MHTTHRMTSRQLLPGAYAALMCFSAGYAIAAEPTPAEADYLKAVSRVIAQAGVWHQKDAASLIKEAKQAAQLERSAARVFGENRFGPMSPCLQMATYHYETVLALNAIARQPPGAHGLLSGMRSAMLLGDAYRQCRTHVDKR